MTYLCTRAPRYQLSVCVGMIVRVPACHAACNSSSTALSSDCAWTRIDETCVHVCFSVTALRWWCSVQLLWTCYFKAPLSVMVSHTVWGFLFVCLCLFVCVAWWAPVLQYLWVEPQIKPTKSKHDLTAPPPLPLHY